MNCKLYHPGLWMGIVTFIFLFTCPSFSQTRHFEAENLTEPDSALFCLDEETAGIGLQKISKDIIDINNCHRSDFLTLPFLSEQEIDAVFEHRQRYGPFISHFELQSVKGLSRNSAMSLLPFVKCGNVPQERKRIFQLSGQSGGVSIRYNSSLKDSNTLHLGPSFGLTIRYQSIMNRWISYGFSVEKDAGEPFLWRADYRQSHMQRLVGFDNVMVSLAVRNAAKYLPIVIIGSYTIGFGQGLLIWQGYSLGKSSLTLQTRKLAPELKPVFSPTEGERMKGVATTIRVSDKIKATPFLSFRMMDASVRIERGTEVEDTIRYISAFDSDGYHRTHTEMQGRHAVKNMQYGGRFAFIDARVTAGINLLCTRLSLPLLREPALYRQFFFEGQRLYQASVDYSLSAGGYAVFGEHAVSRNGATAHIAGVQKSLHPKLDMAWVLRSFARDYHTLTGSALAESSLPVNERGSYLGVEWRPAQSFLINAYADLWHHPWPGYQRSAPAMGRDMLLRILWRKKRKADIYIQWKMETEQKDEPGGKTASMQSHTTQRLRGHAQFTLSPGWQWRCRAEWSWYVTGQVKKGFLLFQDVIYKPVERPWSITARLAFFDIDDFDARIYSYEHDVLFTSSIPFVQGQGTRCNLLIRRTIARKGRAELRWSVTRRRLPKEDAYHSGRGDAVEQHLTLQWSWRW